MLTWLSRQWWILYCVLLWCRIAFSLLETLFLVFCWEAASCSGSWFLALTSLSRSTILVFYLCCLSRLAPTDVKEGKGYSALEQVRRQRSLKSSFRAAMCNANLSVFIYFILCISFCYILLLFPSKMPRVYFWEKKLTPGALNLYRLNLSQPVFFATFDALYINFSGYLTKNLPWSFYWWSELDYSRIYF